MTATLPRAVAVLVVCCAAVMAGCGDSPSTPTPNPPATQPPVTPPPAPPAPPAAPPTLGITKVLAFGDSMTEGVIRTSLTGLLQLDAGLSVSYPFKLQALMSGRYTAQTIQVFNAGRAGERVTDARDRFNGAMSEARPDVILLLEGANDFNQPFGAGEGINARIATTISGLEDLVRDAGFRGIPIMLATLPPQRPGGRSAGAAEFLTRANEAIKAMAGKKGAQLVDIGAQVTLAEIGGDGLHPTEAGYQHMADIWFEALKARFER